MVQSTLFALILSLLPTAIAFAQPSIFVVRHAERADMVAGAPPATDPSLSDAGRERAASLASLLKDAAISTIFVTEFKRTQETAAPLAKALGLTPVTIVAKDTAALVARLKKASGNVLVVGHSDTVPEIIKSLGAGAANSIGEKEFDNLFIVTPGQPQRFVRLHYR
jgi:broad specificity phosphatase PhoE